MAETAEVTTESIEESTDSSGTPTSPSEGTLNTAQDSKPVFSDQQQHWIEVVLNTVIWPSGEFEGRAFIIRCMWNCNFSIFSISDTTIKI